MKRKEVHLKLLLKVKMDNESLKLNKIEAWHGFKLWFTMANNFDVCWVLMVTMENNGGIR
jgi:hypothetical protein